jgi:thioredoxin 1
MIAPLVDALGRDYAGRVKVGKLDVDRHSDVAARYGIMSIPTLLVFRNGEVVDQVVGARPRAELCALLDAHVGEKAPAEP